MPDQKTTTRSIPHRRSLSGHDAYCHVCWEPVYALWIDKSDDPAGECMHGHAKAHACPEAMSRAQFAGRMAKLRAEG